MKLKLALLSTLLIATRCTLTKNSFNVGHKQQTDSLIDHTEERGRGSPDYSLNFSKTYVGDNYHIITQVTIRDAIDDGGAYAAVVAGGPGYTYVTLTYTILRHADFHYEVMIYGKQPAFRKIP